MNDASPEVVQLAKDWPLAFEFDLLPEAKVVIAGAYKGLAMELIRRLYRTSSLYGFEPQSWAAQEAASRMRAIGPGRAWWQVEPFGLGVESIELPMGEWHTDAASFIHTGEGSREQGSGHLKEFDKAMKAVGLESIDLFVLNTEGYEWVLLPYLSEIGWLEKIDRLAVQFHLGMGNEDNNVLALVDSTHERRTDNFPSWVYWVKK